MGDVTLKIHADVTGAIAGVDQVGNSMKELNQETQQYAKKSQQGFMSTAEAAKLVNKGIQELEGRLKSLTAQTVSMQQSRSKWGEAEKRQFEQLNQTIDQTKKQLSDLKQKQADLGGEANKSMGLFGKLGGIMAGAFSVGAIISYSKEAVALAGQVEGVKQAFDRLNKPGLLEELTAATRGTVSEMDLMKNAVKASNFKIPMEQLATFFEFATKRAAQTGESVDYLVESIILGIGRKSPLILDNLGISAVALREKFKGVGMESAAIGDVSKAMGEIVQEELDKMGNVSLTTAQKFEQIRASGERIKEQFGKGLIQVFSPLIDVMNDLVTPTESAVAQFESLSKTVEKNDKSIVPLLDEYDKLASKTDLNSDEQERMNELIKLITTNIPYAATEFDKYGNAIKISTDKARDFMGAQQEMLKITNKKAIEELKENIKSATFDMNNLQTKIKNGFEEVAHGFGATAYTTKRAFTTEEMKDFQAQLVALGVKIKDSENAIKSLSGEKIDVGGEDATAKVEEVVISLDYLKKKLEELKKAQSAAPLEQFASFQPEIDKLEAQIALYDKKKEEKKKADKDENEAWRKGQDERLTQEIQNDINAAEAEKASIEYNKKLRAEYIDWEISVDAAKYEEELKLQAEANKKLEEQRLELEKFTADHPIAAALGFQNEEQLGQVRDYTQQIMSFVNDMVAQQVEARTRLVEDWNQKIDEQQQLVEQENEDKKAGLANSYELEKENLAKMQKERDKAIKDREKAIKIQRTLSTVESSISLITAAANIMKGFSGIPIVGVVLGLAAVAAMIAGFVAAQGKVKDATKMAKGGQAGLLTGPRHTQGGIPIEAEGGEWFINRKSSQKYSPLLDAINRDDQAGMKLFFDRKFLAKMPKQSGFDIDKSKKLGEITRLMKQGKADIIYGDGFILEKIGGYTKKINLN